MKSVNQNTIDTVKIQLLQTLSILIQNLKSEMALCKASIFILIGNFIHFFHHLSVYLLSNNHINELISHKWDFSNEDVLANYISFLKTISLQLNPRTIQFFFNGVFSDINILISIF